MKYLLGLLLALLFLGCLPSSKLPKSYSLDNTELVYLNYFNAEDSIFWIGMDSFNYAELDEGYYYYKSLDSQARFNAPHFEIEQEENFSVEMAILSPSNEDSIFYGLVVGEYGPSNHTINLWVNDLGQYKIYAKHLIFSGDYKMGASNGVRKLKVLKKELNTHFFINDQLIYSYVLEPLTTFRCGPITSSAIWMDYMKIEKEEQQELLD